MLEWVPWKIHISCEHRVLAGALRTIRQLIGEAAERVSRFDQLSQRSNFRRNGRASVSV